MLIIKLVIKTLGDGYKNRQGDRQRGTHTCQHKNINVLDESDTKHMHAWLSSHISLKTKSLSLSV